MSERVTETDDATFTTLVENPPIDEMTEAAWDDATRVDTGYGESKVTVVPPEQVSTTPPNPEAFAPATDMQTPKSMPPPKADAPPATPTLVELEPEAKATNQEKPALTEGDEQKHIGMASEHREKIVDEIEGSDQQTSPEASGDNRGDDAIEPPEANDGSGDGGDDDNGGASASGEGPERPTAQEVYNITSQTLINADQFGRDGFRYHEKVGQYDTRATSYHCSEALAHPETGADEQAHLAMIKGDTGVINIDFSCPPNETDDEGNRVIGYNYQVAVPAKAYQPGYHIIDLAALAGVSTRTYDDVVAGIYRYTDEKPTVEDVQAGFTETALPVPLDEPVIIASTYYPAEGPQNKTEVVGASPHDAEHFARLGTYVTQRRETMQAEIRNTAHTEAFIDANQTWLSKEAAKVAEKNERANIGPDDLKQIGVVALLDAAENQRDAVLDGQPMDTTQLKRDTRQNIRDAFSAVTREKDFNAIRTSADMVERINARSAQKGLPPLDLEGIALATGRPVSADNATTVTAKRIHQYMELTTYVNSLEQLQAEQSAHEAAGKPAATTPAVSIENLVGSTPIADPEEAVTPNQIRAIVEHYLAGSRDAGDRFVRERRLRILFRHKLGIANNHENASIEHMWHETVEREEARAISDLRWTREVMRNEARLRGEPSI